MAARDKSRFTTRQAGWIALAVFAAWVVFLLVPRMREPKPSAPTALPPVVVTESKLQAVGLADNPDWYGLPDYFAIWAGSVEWVENRAIFAYWNPGSYSYSYFFEARREGGQVRFRNLPAKPAGGPLELDDDALAEYARARKGDSPTHPFVFATKLPTPVTGPALRLSRSSDPMGKPGGIEKVEVNPGVQPIAPPAVKFPEQPHVESRK